MIFSVQPSGQGGGTDAAYGAETGLEIASAEHGARSLDAARR